MKTYLEKTDAKFFYFVSTETVNPEARLQSRMIFYNGEDPATGSAAGPCAAWAVKNGVVPAGKQVLIEQGVEMKRRSRIFFSAGRNGDKIVNVRVGGHAVEVVRGEFVLIDRRCSKRSVFARFLFHRQSKRDSTEIFHLLAFQVLYSARFRAYDVITVS